MKDRWKKLAAKFDALVLRERIMVLAATVFVTVFVVHAIFIDPAARRRAALNSQVSQQRAALATLTPQIADLEKRIADPDAPLTARQDAIKREITQIDETLKGMQQQLVAAQNMKALLQQMLARNSRLQLVSLQSLPVEPLVEKRGTPDAAGRVVETSPAPAGAVFKHGVKVTVQGSYADLYDYLARLEKLPWHMFWSRAVLDAENYPRVTLTVTIYTLSLDKAWLVV